MANPSMAWFIGLSYSGEWRFSSIRFSIRKYMHYRHPLPSSCPFFFVFFPIIIVVVEVAVINFLICRLVLLVRSLAILPLLFESDFCFLEYESYILKYEPQMVACSLLRPKLSRATSRLRWAGRGPSNMRSTVTARSYPHQRVNCLTRR